MTKNELKAAVAKLIHEPVDDLEWSEKLALVRGVLVQADKDAERDASKKGESWTDDELRIVLHTAPTRENCMALARAFQRGYGSIEQIFRWAAEDDKTIQAKRPDHAFVQQIRRIKKEIGWIAD